VVSQIDMMVYSLLYTISWLVTTMFGFLPDSSFLAMPTAMTSALTSLFLQANYYIYLFGDNVGNAFMACFFITVTGGMMITIYTIILKFQFPIINRIFRR